MLRHTALQLQLPGTCQPRCVSCKVYAGCLSVFEACSFAHRLRLPVSSHPQVHQETFGRSGCRRIVPGQYVAADPKGRACIIGAVEKQKFVYVLNRDSAANLTISSPLEAHKSHNIVFSMTALDCGFDNPVFAAIELDYADADQVGGCEAYQQQQQQQGRLGAVEPPLVTHTGALDGCGSSRHPRQQPQQQQWAGVWAVALNAFLGSGLHSDITPTSSLLSCPTP